MIIPCKQCILLCVCINKTGTQIRDSNCEPIDQYIRYEINRLVTNDIGGVFSDADNTTLMHHKPDQKYSLPYVGFITTMIDKFSIQTELNKPYVSNCLEQLKGSNHESSMQRMSVSTPV